jgi:hypothetical protein
MQPEYELGAAVIPLAKRCSVLDHPATLDEVLKKCHVKTDIPFYTSLTNDIH